MYIRQIARLMVPLVLGALTASCGRSPGGPDGVTIAYSNDMHGEIRACGCAVHDYGGLGRRATFLEAVRDTAGDFLLLEGGGFFGSKVNYGRQKADLTLESLRLMKYDAVAVGEEEFGFGVDYLAGKVHALGLPVLACNVYDPRADTLLFAPHRVVTLRSGRRAAIIGATSERLRMPPQVRRGTLRVAPAARAIAAEVRSLADSVDLLVVVAHMTRGEAQRIARDNEAIDVIVHGGEGRPMRRMRPFGNAWLLQLAEEGRYMGVAWAVLDGAGGVRAVQNVVSPLSGSYEDAPGVAKLFRAYDLNIAAKEKSDVPAGVLEARRGLKKPYAGEAACRECHEEISRHWDTTKHAHAFATLEKDSREYDRDCTPCHTTGFHERGGFVSRAVTPGLVNVQCESCHGNGQDHVSNPDVAPDGDVRAACRECHEPDRSEGFRFETFWPRIAHPRE